MRRDSYMHFSMYTPVAFATRDADLDDSARSIVADVV
jgi:hypothetical protein